MSVYRIAVSHEDPDHPGSEVAHWGPAFDPAYRAMAAVIRDVPADEIDLLEDAKAMVPRALADHEGEGWSAHVLELTDDGWKEVK